MTTWKLTVTDTDGTITTKAWECETGCYAKETALSLCDFEEVARVTLEHGDDFYVVCRKGYFNKIV